MVPVMSSDLPPGPPLAPLPEAPASWEWPADPTPPPSSPEPVEPVEAASGPSLVQTVKTVAGTALVVAISLLGGGYLYRAATHHTTPSPATAPATVTDDRGAGQPDPGFARGPRGPYGGPGDDGDFDGRPPARFGG